MLYEVPEILVIPPKLNPLISEFNNYQLFLIEGGRVSSKSHTVARLLLYLGEQRKLRIVCGREFQANIEESVHTLLKDLINQYELAYIVLKTKIIHKFSGTEFSFKGFRDQGSASIKGLEGVDILWIDEAQSVSKDTLDVIMPTIRKAKARCYFTMNRFLREDAVPEYCLKLKECLHIKINYHENPFCPESSKIQAENMRAKSERDYRHIWLGEPLAQSDSYLFNFDKLHAAYDIQPFGELYKRQRVMGIDFAAQGNDLCVATILDRVSNQHWKLTERIPWDESDTMVSVGKIVSMIGEHKPDVVIIDIGGMGKPVFDRLQEVLNGSATPIYPFDGGSTHGIDTTAYGNIRAAAYYTLKDWFDNGFLCIDRKDKDVITELEKIKMKYRSNGVRLIQSKVDMKKELKYSPDNADSLNMAVWAAVNYMKDAANSRSGGLVNVIRKSYSDIKKGSRRHR